MQGGAGAGGGAGGSSCALLASRVRRPLASFIHVFLVLEGALPHGDGIHGGGKKMAFGGVMAELGFLSYIDSRISISPSRSAVNRVYLVRPDSK